MAVDCNVIRDLLPLYADEVCSEASRSMVDEHVRNCSDCADMLRRLQTREIETDLSVEKNEVIEYQAKRFKRRSATVGGVIAGLFMIPVLVCLIVNLASGAALGWFFVVLAALLVAASLIVIPLMVPEDKLFWTFCAFCVTLVILLAVCSLYSHGGWFFTAASASLFGLSLIFLPFAVRAKPVRKLIGGCNRALLVIAVDVILFANMMNMISLRTKSVLSTIVMCLICAAALALLVLVVKVKREEVK